MKWLKYLYRSTIGFWLFKRSHSLYCLTRRLIENEKDIKKFNKLNKITYCEKHNYYYKPLESMSEAIVCVKCLRDKGKRGDH